MLSWCRQHIHHAYIYYCSYVYSIQRILVHACPMLYLSKRPAAYQFDGSMSKIKQEEYVNYVTVWLTSRILITWVYIVLLVYMYMYIYIYILKFLSLALDFWTDSVCITSRSSYSYVYLSVSLYVRRMVIYIRKLRGVPFMYVCMHVYLGRRVFSRIFPFPSVISDIFV